MTYEETIKYLYNSVPMFQKVGAVAYKEGLENTLILDEHFGHPHKNIKQYILRAPMVKALAHIQLPLSCKLPDIKSDYIHRLT